MVTCVPSPRCSVFIILFFIDKKKIINKFDVGVISIYQETNIVQVPNLSIGALIQKWGAIHLHKSLWDFKSEIGSFHLSDFVLVEVISLWDDYVNIMFHY